MRPRPKRPCGRNLVSGLGLVNRGQLARTCVCVACGCGCTHCPRPTPGATGAGASAGSRGHSSTDRRQRGDEGQAQGRCVLCSTNGDTRGQPHSRAPRTSTSTPNSNPTCRRPPPGRCPAAPPPPAPPPPPRRWRRPPCCPALATPGSACVPPSRPGEPRHGRGTPAPAPISSFTPHTPPAVACTCVRCAWRLRRRRRGGLGRGSGDAQGVRERAGACGWAGGRACARAVWCWARGNAPSEPLDLSPGALRLRAAAPSPRARAPPRARPAPALTWRLAQAAALRASTRRAARPSPCPSPALRHSAPPSPSARRRTVVAAAQ